MTERAFTIVELMVAAAIFLFIIGDTVAISGQGNIRYDESLKTLNTILGTYSIIAWKDSRSF